MSQRQPEPLPGADAERGFVLAVLAPGADADDELAEVRELARTAGVEPVAEIVQRRPQPAPRTYVGKGKVEELKDAYARAGAESLLVDDELTPSQQRFLENTLQTRVIDRTHNGPGRTVYDWRHYLAVIQRKPGALRNGAPFLELPEAFKRLQQHLLRRVGGDREMVEILALVLHHDEQAVLVAVELALEDGVPAKTHILNRLHRLIDGKPATPLVVTAPQALTLANEPRADVERYDALRQVREARHAS